MAIDLREQNRVRGILFLCICLSEIIKDALKIQALEGMQGGMSGEAAERWKDALMELDAALDQMRASGLTCALEQLGRKFDHVVDHILKVVLNSDSFGQEVDRLEGQTGFCAPGKHGE